MAFFQVLFLVRLSDNLFQIGFIHSFTGVRLLKSLFYYCGSIANAKLKMTQNDDLSIAPKIFEIMRYSEWIYYPNPKPYLNTSRRPLRMF